MKRALVHDRYNVVGGAEKVVHSINNIWDDFDHFSLVDFLSEKDREYVLNGSKVTTSFLQKLPFAKKIHNLFLQFFPMAIEQFDLEQYDIIISSSGFVSKGILTHPHQIHICYCHSPMRYAWDLYHKYLRQTGLNTGLKSVYIKYVLHKFRLWDITSLNRVDFFIANSKYIAKRIKKFYGRDSVVIYPPVDVGFFSLELKKEDYYVTVSRLVPHKRIDIIIEAFNRMPSKKLVVVGDGEEYKKFIKLANSNVKVVGRVNQEDLKMYMQKAKAFIFAADEDFGITPVEAQSAGTPVICFGKGGCLETVIENKTGLFFKNQTSEDIISSVLEFETLKFNYKQIREHAEKFSIERFEKEIKNFVEECINLNSKRD